LVKSRANTGFDLRGSGLLYAAQRKKLPVCDTTLIAKHMDEQEPKHIKHDTVHFCSEEQDSCDLTCMSSRYVLSHCLISQFGGGK